MAGGEIDRLDNRIKNEINEKNRVIQDHQQLLLQVSKISFLEKENQELRIRLGKS